MKKIRTTLVVLLASGVFFLWTLYFPTRFGWCPRFSAYPNYRFAFGIILTEGAINVRFARVSNAELPPGWQLISTPIQYDEPEPVYMPAFSREIIPPSYWKFRVIWDRLRLDYPMSSTPGLVRPQYRRTIINIPVWLIDLVVIALLWRRFRHISPNQCKRCRYDLRGSLDSAVCPECGTAISEEQKERIRATVGTVSERSP